MAQIFPRELIYQLRTAEPILVRVAEKYVREQIFLPAVEKMKNDFNDDKITQELDNGSEDAINTQNISETIDGVSRPEGRNLFAFIGFDAGSKPTDAIRAKLDPLDPDGPKMKYIRGSQRQNLQFSFIITPPNKRAIYNNTPMPRLSGNISWAERIEFGIPGLPRFLNKPNLPGSKSGGGIQVKNQLRSARFLNRSYLSTIFGTFLAQFK